MKLNLKLRMKDTDSLNDLFSLAKQYELVTNFSQNTFGFPKGRNAQNNNIESENKNSDVLHHTPVRNDDDGNFNFVNRSNNTDFDNDIVQSSFANDKGEIINVNR